MDLLQRYRNLTVLFLVVVAQVGGIAWQARKENDVPLLRVWAVSAVTPVETAIESIRSGALGIFTDYFSFRTTYSETRAVREERDRLRLENELLRSELATAQEAGKMAGFAARSPSKMVGALVIGATAGMGTQSVLIDRGSASGLRRGMAVVTPEGIVGKVQSVYPFASLVLAVTDAGFAAGVESQKSHVRGVLKGLSSGVSKMDYVAGGPKIEPGEKLYTSGEDRVFPRGLFVGTVTKAEDAATFREISVEPWAAGVAPQAVFVIVDPVHGEIPDAPPQETQVFLGPDLDPAGAVGASGATASRLQGTQADQILNRYREIGQSQNHTYGEGTVPNFNFTGAVPASGRGSPRASAASGVRGR